MSVLEVMEWMFMKMICIVFCIWLVLEIGGIFWDIVFFVGCVIKY